MATLRVVLRIRNRYVALMPSASTPQDTGFEIARVERSVRIDAPLDEVWSTIVDPAELAEWLGAEVALDRPMAPGAVGEVVESDGSIRHLLVTDHEPGRRLAWHWWGDGGELSSVELTVRPDGDATRVEVVEVVALATVTAGTAPAFSLAADSLSALDRTWAVALPALAGRLGRKLCPTAMG
jgi:uncharacterized protein YndB with AHSA1/START domain